MSHLLDVNFLLACGWSTHARHTEARTWLERQPSFGITALVELGFIRVSKTPGYRASFEDARTVMSERVGTSDFTSCTAVPTGSARADEVQPGKNLHLQVQTRNREESPGSRRAKSIFCQIRFFVVFRWSVARCQCAFPHRYFDHY